MLKKCKYCGKQYDGDPGSSACPECVEERKHNTISDHVCQTCGIVFPGGIAAKFCPSCITERKKKQMVEYKERKKAGKVRKIGSTDICEVCGRPYIVSGGLQKYCPDCSEEAIREKDRAASRKWNSENTTPEERKKIRREANQAIKCVICGKEFVPSSPALTCSEECSKMLMKKNNAKFERENRKARNQYQKNRLHKKLSEMSDEEKSEYRKRVNKKARENYEKRKLKDAKE